MRGGEKLVQTTTSSPGASAWVARRPGDEVVQKTHRMNNSSVYPLIGIWVSKFTFLHTKLSFSWFLQSMELNFLLAHAGAVVCLSADCNLDFKIMSLDFVGSEKAWTSFLCLFFVKRWLEIDGMYGAFYFCAKSLSFLGVTRNGELVK